GEDRVGIVSFALHGAHPHDVSEILDRHAVAVRAGHHCAQVLMERLGVPATTRASVAVYNTREEIDRLIDGLLDVRRIFELACAWAASTESRSSSTTSGRITSAASIMPTSSSRTRTRSAATSSGSRS